MRRLSVVLLFLALLQCNALVAQPEAGDIGWLPPKSDRLVNDYYGLLNDSQRDSLERRLVAFDDSTSNQIAILVVAGFGGRDISSFAFEVGAQWGIGREGINNGLLIVVKPKDETSGEVELATGRGLEGVLPDIFCKRIIEDEMIPHFRDDDYYGGIVAALDIIEPVCAGEYSYKDYKKDNDVAPLLALLFTLGGIVLVIWVIYKIDKALGGGNGDSWGSGHYGGSPRRSSWTSTNWGGGGFGGGSSGGFGGGFGGFGGGSFGGGGAHGKW